jgi:hypothetical protein
MIMVMDPQEGQVLEEAGAMGKIVDMEVVVEISRVAGPQGVEIILIGAVIMMVVVNIMIEVRNWVTTW